MSDFINNTLYRDITFKCSILVPIHCIYSYVCRLQIDVLPTFNTNVLLLNSTIGVFTFSEIGRLFGSNEMTM